jgi:hypothetical protein
MTRCPTCRSFFACDCASKAAHAAAKAETLAAYDRNRDLHNKMMATILGHRWMELQADGEMVRTPAGNRLRITAQGVAIVPMETTR